MCGNMLQSAVARSLLAEFLIEAVATFFFTIIFGLTFGGAGAGTDGLMLCAVAVGLAAIFLHQSERAHLNPVVSIAVALCDFDFGWVNLLLRILAQILGAILGGLLSVDVWRASVLDFGVNAGSTAYRTLIFEILFTALLVLVFLRTRGVSILAPVVYGFVYLVAILVSTLFFNTGNAILNPAVALGLVIGSSSFSSTTDEGNVWLFLVGPFVGALLGVVFYQLTEALDDGDIEPSTVETTEEVIRTTVTQTRPSNVEMGPVGGPINPQTGYGGRGTAY